MERTTDRRQHRRFDRTALTGRLGMLTTGPAGLELHQCTLQDVSYGGMSFTTGAALAPSADYRFVIDLDAPFRDMVLVKARIVWVRAGEEEQCRVGARFLESSKGWLGPDEDDFE